MTIDEAEDFYEDDEPLEDIFEAFDMGEKFVTGERPRKRPAMTHKRYRERIPNLGRRNRWYNGSRG